MHIPLFSPIGRRLISLLLSFVFLFNTASLAYANLPADKEYKFYYYLHDNLGGIQSVLDDKGNVVCTNDYLPYGEERNGDCMDKDEEDYGFTGKEKDEETGLMYYGARYYDPVIGRFTSMDPMLNNPNLKGEELQELLKDPQALNMYTYARNNPVKYVDPDGKTFIDSLVWTMAVRYFSFRRYDISAYFLDHAIQWEQFAPFQGTQTTSNLYFNTASGDVIAQEIGKNIKDTNEYKNILYNVQSKIKEGKTAGKNTGKFSKNDNSDLFYAMNKFNYTFNAKETENGTYDVNITITDIYDFDWVKPNSVTNVGIDLAVLSQKIEALQTYKIQIDLRENIKIGKEKKDKDTKKTSK